MVEDQKPVQCLCCEVMLPALEETVQQQRTLIKLLRLTIKDQRDRLSAYRSNSAESSRRNDEVC